MQANTIHEVSLPCVASQSDEWEAIQCQEDEWDEADQLAAIRPELSAAWSKLKGALREFTYDLAVAFARASIQERRGTAQRVLCRRAGLVFDRASLRLRNR